MGVGGVSADEDMRLQYLLISASIVRPRRSAKACGRWSPFRAEAEGECKSDGADTEGVDMIWEEKWRYPQLVCVAPSPFLENTAPNAHREGT